MTLRQQLLLLALSVLVLPWAAWQALKQMESLLRQGQQQALEASAEAVSRSLALRAEALPPAGPALPVHALASAPRLDGVAGDWGEHAHPLESDASLPGVRFALGHYNERGLLFLEVDDATPERGEAHWPGELAIDAVLLELETSLGPMRLRLAARADGPFRAAAADGGPAPVLVEGAWRATARGYTVEVALPQGLAVQTLRLVHRDCKPTAEMQNLDSRNAKCPFRSVCGGESHPTRPGLAPSTGRSKPI